MPTNEHGYDALAKQLAEYVEDSAQKIAAAVRQDRVTPFAANASRVDELEYYRVKFGSPTGGLMAPTEAFLTPDGQRIGPLGIRDVYKELAKQITPAPIPEG